MEEKMANIIRRDPFRELMSLDRAMDRMFESMYGEGEFGQESRSGFPMPLDVIENDDTFVVKADIAGIDPDDIEITYTHNNLTIKAEARDEREETEEDGRYHLRERRFGSYCRTISMPGTVDVNAIEAETENGVLILHLPKKEEIKPKRIKVKVNAKKKVIEGKSKDK
jgi:HSP20 family protein